MTPRNIPLFYTLWHLYIEPLAALAGIYQLHCAPTLYHNFMPASASYNPTSQIVYDQLASTYLLFAFIEGVVLRAVEDMRTWRYILFGFALCDVGHCYAAWCEMGTRGVLDLAAWTAGDWVTNVFNVLPLLTRGAFLMGAGLGERTGGKEGAKMP